MECRLPRWAVERSNRRLRLLHLEPRTGPNSAVGVQTARGEEAADDHGATPRYEPLTALGERLIDRRPAAMGSDGLSNDVCADPAGLQRAIEVLFVISANICG
jgi:hypothetical protein